MLIRWLARASISIVIYLIVGVTFLAHHLPVYDLLYVLPFIWALYLLLGNMPVFRNVPSSRWRFAASRPEVNVSRAMNPRKAKTRVTTLAYMGAASATVIMGWLAGSGSLARLMTNALPLQSRRDGFDEAAVFFALSYPEVVLAAILAVLILYLAMRPRRWGKILCAFFGVSWIVFAGGLSLSIGLQFPLIWVLIAGCMMLGAAAVLRNVDAP